MPTKLWAARAALVSMFGTIPDVEVIDGPMARRTKPKAFLTVGTDGGETGAGETLEDGATAAQTLSPVANNWRDEQAEIVCGAWAWSGGTEFAPLRATVKGVVDAAEALVQADRTLDGVIAKPGFAEFGALRVREVQTSNGAVVRAAFTVVYTALIET